MLGPDFLLNAEIMPTVASIRQMDLFLPLPLGADAVTRRGDENYNLMARLKDGVTMEQADADVAAIAARIRDKDKRDRTFTIDVVPLLDQVVGNVRRAVLVLLGSVTLVLLIACANVANLLLTRATARQKEVAIRTALGAGWQRLVRQLLTESVLLGVLGGAAGLLIAKAALFVVHTVNPGQHSRGSRSSPSTARCSGSPSAVSILTGIIFGLAPACRAARPDLNTALKAGGRNTQGEGGFGSSRRRLRSLLVVAEVALSLMLLVGAGLLIRSFVRLQQVTPGFNPEDVISMRLGASGRQFPNPEARIEYFRQFSRPHRRGAGRAGARRGHLAPVHVVGRLGIDQRRGLDAAAGTGAAGRSARRHARLLPHHGDAAPAGAVLHQLRRAAERGARGGHRREVRAAVLARAVGDRQAPLERSETADDDRRRGRHRQAVRPRRGRPDRRLSPERRAARISGGADRRAIRRPSQGRLSGRSTRSIPTIPVYDIRTMPDRMSDSLARQRFATIMLGAFALFALVLAVVGVYGVMSHLVSQGTHDIGVRMALGAQRSRIVGMILRQGAELTGAGLVVGLIGAAALTRVMATLLFGIGAHDLVTFMTVPLRARWDRAAGHVRAGVARDQGRSGGRSQRGSS